MTGEGLQGREGVLGTHHLDQFHLFELVLTDHTAGVLAIGAGLAAKARGMRDPLARHGGPVQDQVPHQIGHGHLGGGYQVKILLARHLEKFLLELGQLPGPVEALGIDQIGDIDLDIAMLAGVGVEHELNQGPVQPCQRTAQDHEA